jgi:glycosyltransferase involved in cell wall biosynthesis
MDRRWWDAGVATTDDLFGGTLSLKSRRPDGVTFTELMACALPPVCHLSVVITCYRFAKRLRATLRNWCHQNLPIWSYEVLIVTPRTSDTDREYLAETCEQFSQVRQISVEPELATNKGAMINRGIEASRGRWIWLTDADCLFSADSARTTLQCLRASVDCLYYGERWNLSKKWTDAVLSQAVDPVTEFPQLSRDARTPTPDVGPYGFTQIAHRSVFERIRYREHINHFARTDDLFADECKRGGLRMRKVPGLYCLHLVHPFAWYGTEHLL